MTAGIWSLRLRAATFYISIVFSEHVLKLHTKYNVVEPNSLLSLVPFCSDLYTWTQNIITDCCVLTHSRCIADLRVKVVFAYVYLLLTFHLIEILHVTCIIQFKWTLLCSGWYMVIDHKIVGVVRSWFFLAASCSSSAMRMAAWWSLVP
jgi:hypothetical protein